MTNQDAPVFFTDSPEPSPYLASIGGNASGTADPLVMFMGDWRGPSATGKSFFHRAGPFLVLYPQAAISSFKLSLVEVNQAI